MNTLRVTIDSVEIDEDNVESFEKQNVVSASFSDRLVYTVTLGSGGLIYDVPFGNIKKASVLRISSDKALEVYINDNSLSNVYELITKADVSKCQLKNNSGSDAEIMIEIYKGE
jgi:hypothetical protein